MKRRSALLLMSLSQHLYKTEKIGSVTISRWSLQMTCVKVKVVFVFCYFCFNVKSILNTYTVLLT